MGDPLRMETEVQGGLAGRVMRSVNEHIRSERLKTGDLLPSEAAIALQTGVSRAVVREALRSLATLGIIDIGNGRRARVGAIDEDVLGLVIDHAVQTDQVSIQQIYDVRRTIEMRTVALAALRRSDAEARVIADAAASMRADFTTADKVMEHDLAFHAAIAKASRNPLFALIVAAFEIATRQTWGIGWASRATDSRRMQSIECHERIAAAIFARDQRGAEHAMAEHFDHSVKALLAAGVV